MANEVVYSDGAIEKEAPFISSNLDLSGLPAVYVLPVHITLGDLHKIENHLTRLRAPLTYDIREARLVLGNISKPRRAKFELLQAAKVDIKANGLLNHSNVSSKTHNVPEIPLSALPSTKRQKFEEIETQAKTDASIIAEQPGTSDIGSETEAEDEKRADPVSQSSISQASLSQTIDSFPTPEDPAFPQAHEESADHVKVVNLKWLEDSIRLGNLQDTRDYLVYEAELLPHDATSAHDATSVDPESLAATPLQAKARHIPERSTQIDDDSSKGSIGRAKAETESKLKPRVYFSRVAKRDRTSDATNRDFSSRTFTSTTSKDPSSQPPHLLHQTTSEYEESVSGSLPPMPDWVLQNQLFSCQRSTPLQTPNDSFIDQLKEIRVARLLTNDGIGVRAYSTSIASIAAYPYEIQSMAEIMSLPGCDHKIAHLFHEWQNSPNHCIQAVKDIQADPALQILRQMYEIWGVGATTAREFYYGKQWRDLDDIVEFGWNSLSRVQQIGVKYYDEFLLKLPRAEVEAIAEIVRRHAREIVDERIECIIVGGYRRGKSESGDVDLILSHPEQCATAGLVEKVVRSLENEGWITHTLTLNLTNTKRGQETLPYINLKKGAGFDTLDKALVVWQDQSFSGQGSTDEHSKPIKNPNPHRRVDIIISPWRTVGCAVAGWTSGTTFQRDLRRYAKKVKGWKFDSSGVRERGSGRWIDLERWTDPKTRCTDWKEAERRVFEGMDLQYREPKDRCTG
ncbi:MAG: hypothetical protein LQ348_001230 [Seirophora lacunosa]|nr:MAG: hypothetical protein LQ348_001230 [Seirophora lacunosa]